MKRILILANSASGLYDFRNELLLRLLKEGYEVHISLMKIKSRSLSQKAVKYIIHR